MKSCSEVMQKSISYPACGPPFRTEPMAICDGTEQKKLNKEMDRELRAVYREVCVERMKRDLVYGNATFADVTEASACGAVGELPARRLETAATGVKAAYRKKNPQHRVSASQQDAPFASGGGELQHGARRSTVGEPLVVGGQAGMATRTCGAVTATRAERRVVAKGEDFVQRIGRKIDAIKQDVASA